MLQIVAVAELGIKGQLEYLQVSAITYVFFFLLFIYMILLIIKLQFFYTCFHRICSFFVEKCEGCCLHVLAHNQIYLSFPVLVLVI